ncbi:MAG TPA: NrsF family protein [Thermoanaerobaculaceae bacterium]|nr:NrsF family protein [Thermoanaerobaculaceae bacterium]
MREPAALPDRLRRAVAADLRPVRPLRSPALRAVLVAAWVPVALALVLALLGLRRDLPSLGWPMALAALAVEVAFGLALVALALAESVPARGAARIRSLAALGAAAAALVVQAAVTRGASEGVAVPRPLTTHGPACFAFQLAVGVPALALVALLIARAAPLRARWAGLLGGAGAGLVADGVYHLHCPITDLRHVLVWHGAASAALALAGLVAGLAWERRQARAMRRHAMSRADAPRSRPTA